MEQKLFNRVTKKLKEILEKLKVSHIRYESYSDNHRQPFEFVIGENVFLKVSTMKGFTRFGKKGKLEPSYISSLRFMTGLEM